MASRLAVSLFFLFSHVWLFGQSYNTVGAAVDLGTGCFGLAADAQPEAGAVWYSERVNFEQDFELEFTLNFGATAGAGKGMALVFQPISDNVIGSDLDFGFGELFQSFGVEFDTFQDINLGDPAFDHLCFASNGTTLHTGQLAISNPVQASSTLANVEDGMDHIVRFVWVSGTNTATVFFDCEERASLVLDVVAGIFNGTSSAYFGVVGASAVGGNVQTACLQSNILGSAAQERVCSGGSIVLSAGGDPNGIFSWSPTDFLDNPNAQTPTCTADVETTYTVMYEDLCGIAQTKQVIVAPEEVALVADNVGAITCLPGGAQVAVSSNFADLNYNWTTTNGNIMGATNALNLAVESPGSYTLSATGEGTCAGTLTVEVQEDLSAFLVQLPADGQIDCNDAEYSVAASVGAMESEFTFEWVGEATAGLSDANILSPTSNAAGLYILEVTKNTTGCTSRDSVVVVANLAPPVATILPPDSLSCNNPTVLLDNISFDIPLVMIDWSSSDGNITEISSAGITVDQPGDYVFHAANPENGCETEGVIMVRNTKLGLLTADKISLPDVITPNGDGKNDFFKLYLPEQPTAEIQSIIEEFTITVYDRWGTLVFQELNSFAKGWDGVTVAGARLQGTFFYEVSFKMQCNTEVSNKINGTLTILDHK